MKEIKNVWGAKELAVPLICQTSTVYLKTRIREIDVTNNVTGEITKVWCWNEIQMSYREYFEHVAKQQNEQKTQIDSLMISAMNLRI